MAKTGPYIVGERLRTRLDAVGKTQEWLARHVGMSQQGVQSIVSGVVERPRKIREIANALSTSQEYLLGETDDPEPAPSSVEFFSVYEQLPASVKRDLMQEALRQLQQPKRK